MANDRYGISLGQPSGELAEQLRALLDLRQLVDVVRLGLSALRMLVFADRQGLQVVVRAPNGREFSYSLLRPNDLVELPSELAKPQQNVQVPANGIGTLGPSQIMSVANSLSRTTAVAIDLQPYLRDKSTDLQASKKAAVKPPGKVKEVADGN